MGVYHSGAHKNRQVYPCAFGGTYRKKYFNWCIVVVLKLCCTQNGLAKTQLAGPFALRALRL